MPKRKPPVRRRCDTDLTDVQWDLIAPPGKPRDNVYIETFNGSLRDECLNIHWFRPIAEASITVAFFAGF